jgi:hypothetical protein
MDTQFFQQIFIDPDVDIVYSENQAYVDYPTIIHGINFELIGTVALNEIADKIRSDYGKVPFFTGENQDIDGWYKFIVGANDYTKTGTDTCITFIVENSSVEEDYDIYYIELSESDQLRLYERLNDECVHIYGKTLNELMNEHDSNKCNP